MKKIIVLGMLAVLLTFGLVLMSCGGCPGSGNCDGSKASTVCATSVKDADDSKTAAKCAAFKGILEGKGKCDC